MNPAYSPHVRNTIVTYEQSTGNLIPRKAISFDPDQGTWTFDLHTHYKSFAELASNHCITKPKPKPKRKPRKRATKNPEIALFEQQYGIRIYGHSVKRTKDGWSCTSLDQSIVIKADNLRDLLILAPHAFRELPQSTHISKQARVPKIKEVVANLDRTPSPKKDRYVRQPLNPNIIPGYNVRRHKDQFACLSPDKKQVLYFPSLETLFASCPYVLSTQPLEPSA